MSKNSRNPKRRRLINVRAAVEQIRAAARAMNASRSRYAAYEFLSVVYDQYWNWFIQGHSDERIKSVIQRSSDQRHTNNEHPIKMLIKAAHCSSEAKVLSRWVRALEYISLRQARPHHVTYLLDRNGGIAGCARLAAKMDPKRTPPPDRDDWADDSPVRHI
jgi:hypothetical protein